MTFRGARFLYYVISLPCVLIYPCYLNGLSRAEPHQHRLYINIQKIIKKDKVMVKMIVRQALYLHYINFSYNM